MALGWLVEKEGKAIGLGENGKFELELKLIEAIEHVQGVHTCGECLNIGIPPW